MNINISMDRYRLLRHGFYEWQNELALAQKVLLAFGFACLTGLLAQFRIFIPGNPIPITGQVFAVLLAGVILGSRFGALSQGLYVGLGAAGVPWLAGVTGTVTAGYLVGFVVAAAFIGWATQISLKTRQYHLLLGVMMIGVGIIYALGAIWFGLVTGMGIGNVLAVAVAPFVLGDIVKALAAAAMGTAVSTKQT